MSDIFEKIQLTPSQLRTVADRRYDDAEYLRKSALNRHANGVYYIGGFVLECLLKAMMLDKHPELRTPPKDFAKLSAEEKHRFQLVYRWHDLQAILVELPEVNMKLDIADPTGRLTRRLTDLCNLWNVFARYSPRTAIMEDAAHFLADIKDLKPWLR